ncbi:hypothetical protein ACOSQ2_028734 [Xanthoceras sorbifolium]
MVRIQTKSSQRNEAGIAGVSMSEMNPAEQRTTIVMCNFPTIKDAADVTIASMLSGIQVSRVELLDEVQVRAVNIANGKNLSKFPTLMFEFIGTGATIGLSL